MNKINQIFQINGEDFVNGKLKLILNRIKSKILITYGCEKIPKDILRIINVISGIFMEDYLPGIEER